MMETLDSGIGSRSPTPDSNSSHSQTNSSKVTKVATHTNHINNNSHNNMSRSNANGIYSSSKTKGSLENGNTSSTVTSSNVSSTTPSNTASTTNSSNVDSSGNNSGGNNQNGGSSGGGNNHNTSSNNKTYRDYNNRHSTGHGQYKKYNNHQNHHYGYGSHNNLHYQRYNNGNGHRNYGNNFYSRHYHNSSNYHHNNHNNYQGQSYHHHYNQQQNHHHQQNNSSSTSNGGTGNSNANVNNSGSGNHNSNGGSHSNSHPQQHQPNHHNSGNSHQNQQQSQSYYNGRSSAGTVNHQNPHNQHNNIHPNHYQPHQSAPAPPQVFISSEVDPFSWTPRQGGVDNTSNTNWSSPNNVDTTGDSSSTSSTVQINLNLSALKQGFYSPSPQDASPATSPSTTDSSDTYSLQEESTGGTTTGTGGSTTSGFAANGVRHNNLSSNNNNNNCIDTVVHYTTAPGGGAILDPNASYSPSLINGTAAAAYPYTQFHPQAGFFTYPGAGHHHLGGGGRNYPYHQQSHHHHPLISHNFGLLMPADLSYPMGKADSSISSSSSDKTLEWSDDGTYVTCTSGDRGDEYVNPSVASSYADNRCTTPEYYYTPYTIAATGSPFTPTHKKRFYNGTGTATGKLSQAVQNQRYHHFPRKMAYHLPGFPREWFDDLDPEEYVRAFSKFGEVKERPEALSQTPQCDSLSEGIWLKFVANQQTTDTFRKKMELWRDVYRIVRSLNYNSHFKHDPRNFPSFGLQVVGSTMSGFGSNTSDVDMCLLVRGSEVDQRYEAVDKLQVLYGALSATQWLDNVELIYAKVPILKFRDPKRCLEVDLNCNNFVGIRNTHLLYCYSQADWRLKPLVLVVKLWAHYHGINDAKNMTISSYSLVLMVIHFLQCGMEQPVLPVLQQSYPEKFSNTTNILNVKINEVLPSWTSKNEETIGNLLIQFLEYYAKRFDYSENAVSVRSGRTIPIKQAAAYKSPKNDPHQWKFLCIEEPFDRTNTARSVYDRDTFDKIIGIFNLSFERLQASRNLESIFTPISDSDIRAMSSLLIR